MKTYKKRLIRSTRHTRRKRRSVRNFRPHRPHRPTRKIRRGGDPTSSEVSTPEAPPETPVDCEKGKEECNMYVSKPTPRVEEKDLQPQSFVDKMLNVAKKGANAVAMVGKTTLQTSLSITSRSLGLVTSFVGNVVESAILLRLEKDIYVEKLKVLSNLYANKHTITTLPSKLCSEYAKTNKAPWVISIRDKLDPFALKVYNFVYDCVNDEKLLSITHWYPLTVEAFELVSMIPEEEKQQLVEKIKSKAKEQMAPQKKPWYDRFVKPMDLTPVGHNPFSGPVNPNAPIIDYNAVQDAVLHILLHPGPKCIQMGQLIPALMVIVHQMLVDDTSPTFMGISSLSGMMESIGHVFVFFLLRRFVADVYLLSPKMIPSSTDELRGKFIELMKMLFNTGVELILNAASKKDVLPPLVKKINEMLEFIDTIKELHKTLKESTGSSTEQPSPDYLDLIVGLLDYIDTTPLDEDEIDAAITKLVGELPLPPKPEKKSLQSFAMHLTLTSKQKQEKETTVQQKLKDHPECWRKGRPGCST